MQTCPADLLLGSPQDARLASAIASGEYRATTGEVQFDAERIYQTWAGGPTSRRQPTPRAALFCRPHVSLFPCIRLVPQADSAINSVISVWADVRGSRPSNSINRSLP